MGSRKQVFLSSMVLFLLFHEYTESNGSAPGNKTENTTVTTTTTTVPTSIFVAVGTGTIVAVALTFVLLFCCRLRSMKAERTPVDATPDDNMLVSTRPSHRRRIPQGASTVVSMHQYSDSFPTQQQQDIDPDAFNDPIYGNVSSSVLQDRWNWGQRLSRAVRRFLPLSAADPGVKDQCEVCEQDEWDVYSDSPEDAVYANCLDAIQSSDIK